MVCVLARSPERLSERPDDRLAEILSTKCLSIAGYGHLPQRYGLFFGSVGHGLCAHPIATLRVAARSTAAYFDDTDDHPFDEITLLWVRFG